MTSLPLKHMVLYKHGVGFFVRGGAVSGPSLDLSFRADEVNDVLKSLAVFDRAGGKILSIDYQTPMDRAARLASSSIRLDEQASLRDLLRDLRGRQVTLTVENGQGTMEAASGRVVGIDLLFRSAQVTSATRPENPPVVGIAGADGQVRFFPLDLLRGLQIHDPQSTQDLGYFLDTNMQEENRRSVHVRLSEGVHDLVAQYVAPSPTWRVSYRVVAEAGKDGKSGRALIQGWGLFDNRLEEDLENVSVTLVAGQPISFIYDLYESRIPERPVVRDEVRVAPGPVRMAGKLEKAMPAAAGAAPRKQSAMLGLVAEASAGEERARGISFAENSIMALGGGLADYAGSVAEVAEAEETGEFFEYRVSTPVSVRRGESAMVPILSTEIDYQRELLYNGAKLPDHPVAALRFLNATGLTLESGPVTISEDGDYRGEAVVSFTKDRNEVYLPYAVELGITVVEKSTTEFVTTGIGFRGEYLIQQMYHVIAVHYTIANTSAGDTSITIEAGALNRGYELFDTPAPDSETIHERRWRVSVPARGRATFVRQERSRTRQTEALRGLRFEELRRYLENKWLDRKTFDTLSNLLDVMRSIEQMQGEIAQIGAQRTSLFNQQAQLRENLTTLQGGGEEIQLRARMVNRLEKAQDQLDALDVEQGAVELRITETEARVDQIIASLPQTEDD